jgi:hypothetical protein
MNSAQECLLKAEYLEQQARDCVVQENRAVLLEAAKQWRRLARTASGSRAVADDGKATDDR